MATTTITWKNNSTDQSPTGTKIERYEDFPKGHEHATAPVEVANGNTGGLDPTQANGTYADSSISGGKYYSYSVSTLKGDEAAAGVPTAEEWVADQANDIGYPGGVPVTASTYNCSVAPALHVDFSRAKDYYAPFSQQNTTVERVDNGLAGVFRANTEQFSYANQSASRQAAFLSDAVTDGDGLSLIGQPVNQIDRATIVHPNKIAFKDGVTIFRVVAGDFNNGDWGGIAGTNPMGDGVNYHAGQWQFDRISMLQSGTQYYTLPTGGGLSIPSFSGMTGYRDSDAASLQLYILGVRLNNSLEAYNTGQIKGQVFSAGQLLATTNDVSAKSYHNSSSTEKYGAWYLPASSGSEYYSLQLISPNYKELLIGEHFLFGEALSLNDMNQVFGYLCNKYGVTQQVISASDLVN